MEVTLQKNDITLTATLKFLQTLNSCLCKQMKVAASCRRTAYLLTDCRSAAAVSALLLAN